MTCELAADHPTARVSELLSGLGEAAARAGPRLGNLLAAELVAQDKLVLDGGFCHEVSLAAARLRRARWFRRRLFSSSVRYVGCSGWSVQSRLMYSGMARRNAASRAMLVSLWRGMLFSMWPSIALHPLCSTARQWPVLWSWSYTASLAAMGWEQRAHRPFCSISLSALAAVYLRPLGSLFKSCYLLNVSADGLGDPVGRGLQLRVGVRLGWHHGQPVVQRGRLVLAHPQEHGLLGHTVGPLSLVEALVQLADHTEPAVIALGIGQQLLGSLLAERSQLPVGLDVLGQARDVVRRVALEHLLPEPAVAIQLAVGTDDAVLAVVHHGNVVGLPVDVNAGEHPHVLVRSGDHREPRPQHVGVVRHAIVSLAVGPGLDLEGVSLIGLHPVPQAAPVLGLAPAVPLALVRLDCTGDEPPALVALAGGQVHDHLLATGQRLERLQLLQRILASAARIGVVVTRSVVGEVVPVHQQGAARHHGRALLCLVLRGGSRSSG